MLNKMGFPFIRCWVSPWRRQVKINNWGLHVSPSVRLIYSKQLWVRNSRFAPESAADNPIPKSWNVISAQKLIPLSKSWAPALGRGYSRKMTSLGQQTWSNGWTGERLQQLAESLYLWERGRDIQALLSGVDWHQLVASPPSVFRSKQLVPRCSGLKTGAL